MSKIKTVLLINGVEVGELEYQGVDNFWQYGKFIPYSSFHDYSEIFQIMRNHHLKIQKTQLIY